MKPPPAERWVLAFDASCKRCREVSDIVVRTCNEKLEVIPLTQPEVRQWREQGLGVQAPWAPTLIRVRKSDVRAWTGAAMSIRLVRQLGLRSTVRLLNALGDQHHKDQESTGQQNDTMGRKQFLRLTGGLGVAVGLILTGKTPALADPGHDTVELWAKTNIGSLPERYDDFVKYSMEYRRAIFASLSPKARSGLWVEHLEHYRTAHKGISTEKLGVLDRAIELLSREATFMQGREIEVDRNLKELKGAAVLAFGHDEARTLIATLGPPEETTTPRPECECSNIDDWCTVPRHCVNVTTCMWTPAGCGTGWIYQCNGNCYT